MDKKAEAEILDDMVRQYRAGDRRVLFEAIEKSYVVGLPIPQWVWLELRAALDRYDGAEVKTLGEAFGLPNREDKRHRAKRQTVNAGVSRLMAVIMDVERLHAAGAPIDKSLFEEVAKLHPGLSPGRVENWYLDPEGKKRKRRADANRDRQS